ncbi:hypothetical protein V8G54_036903 [Vigna mungo]|uniref:Uncharacterized protein n=1 Tax=Vigna mungo TaxID=3915 RepID=A0AAQ3MHK9_VIGMU
MCPTNKNFKNLPADDVVDKLLQEWKTSRVEGVKNVHGSYSLKWLDAQPHGSVILVCFGSGGTLSRDQMEELALGLEMSEHRFVWVVKSPNEEVANASYFTEDTGAQVLSHPSIGGFVTHCGWNSILESVVNGAPLVAWALYTEQDINAVLVSEGMKVAVRVVIEDSLQLLYQHSHESLRGTTSPVSLDKIFFSSVAAIVSVFSSPVALNMLILFLVALDDVSAVVDFDTLFFSEVRREGRDLRSERLQELPIQLGPSECLPFSISRLCSMNYIKACSRKNGILKFQKRHFQVDASIIKTGFDPNTYRFNFQVKNHLLHGDLGAARKLFDEMPHKNIISTNTMITGYLNSGNLSTARSLFDGMVERSVVTWTMLIGGYAQNNKFRDAFGLFVDMCRHGLVPDHVTLTTLLSGFTEFDSVNEVAQVQTHVVKLGYDSTLTVCNSLLDSYCKTRSLGLACHLFKHMPERDNVTFNVLLTGYSKEGFNRDAINLFFKMQNLGFKPTEFTFAAVLTAGIQLDDIEFGQQVHSFVRGHGLYNFNWVSSRLILNGLVIIGEIVCSEE